jgi:hypothetical protein
MAGVILGPSSWSIWDSFHGAVAGMLLVAFTGLPAFATVGATGAVIKVLAWITCLTVLVVVYVLLDRHESRTSALLATAGLAFCPPVLFHTATVLGNWHWTQLAFDYGLVLAALEMARRERGPALWALFGLGSGLALFNCIGSLPFLAVAWGILLLAVGARGTLTRFAIAGAGAALGVAPYLYKLLLHRPFGQVQVPADKTLERLTRLRIEPSKLTDLAYPELPRALHVRDVVRWVPEHAAARMELLWVGVVWIGLLVAVYLGLRAWRRGRAEQRRLLPVALVPGLFALLFAGAYVALDTELELLPFAFTNVREAGHRTLPPLLAALLVGSAIGWARLADISPRWRPALLALGAIPPTVGMICQVALIQPHAPGGVSAYRAACGDALGFNAAASFKGDAVAAQRACSGLGEAAVEQDCRAGAAWGSGFHGGEVGSLSVADAPVGWSRSGLALTLEARAVCDALESEPRERCLLGLGWYTGALNWGRERWPVASCDSLPTAADQTACWRGIGFPIGDHLHPSPWKIGLVLERVPPSRRDEVAWGVGLAIGRTWSSPEYGEWLCGQTGMEHVDLCVEGVRSRHPSASPAGSTSGGYPGLP